MADSGDLYSKPVRDMTLNSSTTSDTNSSAYTRVREVLGFDGACHKMMISCILTFLMPVIYSCRQ